MESKPTGSVGPPNVQAALERWVAERTNKCRARGHRRIWSVDKLPMVRVFMFGPKWRRLFDVSEVRVADVDLAAAQYHRPGKRLLVFTLEEDVRELVLEEIRPGVFAQWADPRERLRV